VKREFGVMSKFTFHVLRFTLHFPCFPTRFPVYPTDA
jgi:hypothetical protein